MNAHETEISNAISTQGEKIGDVSLSHTVNWNKMQYIVQMTAGEKYATDCSSAIREPSAHRYILKKKKVF